MRVLHILPELNPSGGIENVVMNYYRAINRDLIQFDFIAHSSVDPSYIDEIRSLGGRVYMMPPFGIGTVREIANKYKGILSETMYGAVHCHMANAAFLYLRIAQQKGIKLRILHSHQNQYADTVSHKIRNVVLVAMGKPYATMRMAPSKSAGDFLFGTKPYLLLPNAIDLEKFRFNPEIRKNTRSDLGVGNDTFVLGTVGRLVPQKNQIFMVNLMPSILKYHPDTQLLIIGEGNLRSLLEERISELRITQNVKLLGIRTDISGLLNALDCFVFPSIYEGLGEALIEAEVNGIPSIASEGVPREAMIAETCKRIPLDQNRWLKEIEEAVFSGRKYERELGNDTALNSRFNISEMVGMLEDIYLA